ncbi:MAG: hypothetical protein Q2306_01815 [Phytoplasma sp.]|uniref:hypothetical protein n=1 Tax=Phytoplasma sp. TaxID=2155 RepID=UPI002B40D90D|nr:hypothetical protein [Phytoplasma sp.]WRH06624.1 MAG: hypothetical protein Q2306_01815 [Phytoplasma sp.]
MKKTFLQKIIIISLFIAITMIIDFVLSPYIKPLKLPLVIICIAGCSLGFPSVFIICCFYTFIHLTRSFYHWKSIMDILQLNYFQICFSVILDYIFPDLIISLSGFCFDKQKKFFSNTRLFSFFLLINCLRLLSFFLSSLLIYANKNNNLKENIFIIAFIYNLLPFFLNLFVGGILFFYLKSKLKNIFGKKE